MLLPLVAAVLGLGATDAHANQPPFMWGVGPTITTIAFPGQHPLNFPKLSEADAALVPAGDVNENRRITSIDEVGGDAGIGARGVIYLDKTWRGGLRFHVANLASNFNAVDFTLEADKMLVSQGVMSAYIGGGLGFGTMNFTSEDNDASLKLNTYVLRGHVGGIYRLKKSAIEVGVFIQPTFPGLATYTATDGETEGEIKGGLFANKDAGGGGSYHNGGLELTVYFGDFRPPKPRKKKGKKGKKGRK